MQFTVHSFRILFELIAICKLIFTIYVIYLEEVIKGAFGGVSRGGKGSEVLKKQEEGSEVKKKEFLSSKKGSRINVELEFEWKFL